METTQFATEEQFHVACYKWWKTSMYRFTDDKMLFSVNNNSHDRREGAKQQAKGVVPGVSDFVLIVPHFVYFIELKLPTGTQSQDQKDFQKALIARGHIYFIVRTLTEFIDLVTKLISNARSI